MRRYLIVTGSLFALMVLAHIARVAEEGMQLAREPAFVAVTVLAAIMSVWAFRLLGTHSSRRVQRA